MREELTFDEREQVWNYLYALKWNYTLRWKYALEFHLNTKREKLTFDDKPFLKRVYLDQNRSIVIVKAVQVYCSEWAVCEALSLAERGFSTFYVLPKIGLRNTFVANRVDPNLEIIPKYKELIESARGSSDSTSMKHFGNGTIKFVHSGSLSEFGEFPADCVIIDELDYCDQENIRYAVDRLEASKMRLERKLGNPSLTGYGIDLEYENSDQKEWMVPCEKCGEWQPLDFFSNVVRVTDEGKYELIDREWTPGSWRDIFLFCKKCGSPLDRLHPMAQWVKKHEDNPASGYRIHHLMRHPIGNEFVVAKMFEEFSDAHGNPTKTQLFYNSRLGLSFVGKGSGFSPTFYRDSMDDVEIPEGIGGTCAGIDVGSGLHVVINYWVTDTKSVKVWCGVVDEFDELIRILKIYGVTTAMIDGRPEARKVEEIQEELKGEIDLWLAYYIETAKSTKAKDPKIDTSLMTVSFDRTTSIDSMFEHILHHHTYPKWIESEKDYLKQMAVPKRVRDEVKGVTRWTKGEDHFFHAENYAYWAWKVKDMSKISIY